MTLQATTEAAPAPEHEAVAQVISHADENSVADEALIADELLVEEVSIDGMCGVY
jgi:mycofactocin precursor